MSPSRGHQDEALDRERTHLVEADRQHDEEAMPATRLIPARCGNRGLVGEIRHARGEERVARGIPEDAHDDRARLPFLTCLVGDEDLLPVAHDAIDMTDDGACGRRLSLRRREQSQA